MRVLWCVSRVSWNLFLYKQFWAQRAIVYNGSAILSVCLLISSKSLVMHVKKRLCLLGPSGLPRDLYMTSLWVYLKLVMWHLELWLHVIVVFALHASTPYPGTTIHSSTVSALQKLLSLTYPCFTDLCVAVTWSVIWLINRIRTGSLASGTVRYLSTVCLRSTDLTSVWYKLTSITTAGPLWWVTPYRVTVWNKKERMSLHPV